MLVLVTFTYFFFLLLHLWYDLKMAVRAKGNYLSGKLQCCAGSGQFGGIEDGDRGDCLFVKRCYYLCQASFWNPRLLNLWCKSKSVFLVNLSLGKLLTINRPLWKLIFSESDIYLKGNAGRAADYLCDQKALFSPFGPRRFQVEPRSNKYGERPEV